MAGALSGTEEERAVEKGEMSAGEHSVEVRILGSLQVNCKLQSSAFAAQF
jgi:hypothetical protein